MASAIGQLFATEGFPPRWTCGTWSSVHGWTHIVSDVAIFGAYFTIPIVLAVLVLRRKDMPFPPVFWLFGLFILSCGFGHLVESTLFWHPWYRFSALVKVVTAVASWATVAVLIPVLPKALALPGLAAINERLRAEVAERERTESVLRAHAEELVRNNRELEQFTDAVLGREDRILSLKQEVNDLLRTIGQEPRYGTDAEGSGA